MIKKIIIALILSLLCACSIHITTDKNQADSEKWILNQDYSSIAIVTTKNNSISEVSEFTSFSGGINSNGYLEISIDLNSLETNIPIRNERIQNLLFDTKSFPSADIHTQLKPEDLTIGVHTISFDVDFHGVSSILTAQFMVFEQYGNKVITLHKPLVINASSFGLEGGINALKSIANLNDISFTVPMNIILSFEKSSL